MFAPDQEPMGAHEQAIQYSRANVDMDTAEATPRTSLLRAQIDASRFDALATSATGEAEDGPGSPFGRLTPSGSRSPRIQPGEHGGVDHKGLESELTQAFRIGSHSSGSIFAVPPHLSTPPIIGSYGSFRSYGTVGSRAEGRSMEQAAAVWRQQQETALGSHGDVQPILVKEVEQDGKIVLQVEGQSTLPQTVFNSIKYVVTLVNPGGESPSWFLSFFFLLSFFFFLLTSLVSVLIGVGLLSLPMGLNYSGWLVGMTFLFLAAVVTAYTAKLLAKCMDLDPSLISFSDVAYISFGRNARFATSILFTLELVAACVALIVLFADSLDLLFPGLLSVDHWKVLCAFVLIPLNFLPLRLLSFTSFIGILSCLSSK
jgi:vesicular inhibitory amino acid transporter